MRFTRWLGEQVRKQLFSFVGAIVGGGMMIYNTFKPTHVTVVSQSALGGSSSSLFIGLGAIGVFVIVVSVVAFFVVRDKNKNKKKKR